MEIIMNTRKLKTIGQIKTFLFGVEPVSFTVIDKANAYQCVQDILQAFRYPQLSKKDKGLLVQYLVKLTGYSRQQITRLITQFKHCGILKKKNSAANGFAKKYTSADIRLLAQVDEWHDTLNGPATKKLCERAYDVFGQKEYERLAKISVLHLYNLRKSTSYTQQRWHYEKTRPNKNPIGERRKPRSEGKPGYLRIDSVHQGDLDKQKGVYHINAVDEVTQFEIVATVERISEYHLIPVLEELLDSFPFVILGVHSDNGSEYINKNVATLLNKLLIEFTKSRPRHSNDNALAECKNGAIVRKVLGYNHIPQKYAVLVNTFNKRYLNPYVNYHRPCFFPEIQVDKRGKEIKKYSSKTMDTPYEKFKSLPNASNYLRPGLTFEDLDREAMSITDNVSAQQLQTARAKLMQEIYKQPRVPETTDPVDILL
jgi:transposase InsO family protein